MRKDFKNLDIYAAFQPANGDVYSSSLDYPPVCRILYS